MDALLLNKSQRDLMLERDKIIIDRWVYTRSGEHPGTTIQFMHRLNVRLEEINRILGVTGPAQT